MTLSTPNAVRCLAICSAVGLVVASAGFGSVYAYRVGIEHSIFLAGLSVLMALGLEGVKPLAIGYALRAHSLKTGVPLLLLGLVAVAYSLTSELSLVASSRSDLTASRLALADVARETVGKKERITAELRSLGVQRPSEAIQAEINPLVADKRLNNCQGWLASTRLRETCIEKVAPLQAELAAAERREKLEADLNSLGTANHGGQAVFSADPGSAALVTYLGVLGLSVSPETVAQWLILVPVMALEFGSAFVVVLVGAVSPAAPVVQAKAQRTRAEPRQKAQAQAPAIRDATAQRIVDRLKSAGGSVASTERALADAIGASRPTVRRALNSLVLAGLIGLEAGRQGTFLRLT